MATATSTRTRGGLDGREKTGVLGSSRFLLGLLHETPQAVAAQLQLWQDSDVVNAAWQQAASRSNLVRNAGAAIAKHVAQPVSQRVHDKLGEMLPGHFGADTLPADSPHALDAHIGKLDRVRLGMLSRRHPSTSSSGSKVRRRNSTTMASWAGVSTVLHGTVGPMGASAVVVRLRHLLTVVRLKP